MTVVPHRAFKSEHDAMDRLDGPIGQEIARVGSDFEQLVSEFTERGAVDTHSIYMIRAGLDRLEEFGKLCALRDDLAEKARAVSQLVDYLGSNQDPGALTRLRGRLDFQMEEVRNLADSNSS